MPDSFRPPNGACGVAGLHDAQKLTHKMESAFDAMRAGRVSLSDAHMTGFLQVADRLREVVDQIRADAYVPWGDDQVEALVGMWTGASPAVGTTASVAAPAVTTPAKAPPASLTDGVTGQREAQMAPGHPPRPRAQDHAVAEAAGDVEGGSAPGPSG